MQSGVIVPREAVVRTEGTGWVYVQNAGGEAYTRMEILLDHPGESGWFISQGMTTNDYVVVTGAQQLLSEELKGQGIAVRVIDLYCVKPIDGAALGEHIRATGGRLITVEDHYPEGGLGDTVVGSLAEAGVALSAYKRLAVNGVSHSGKPDELLDAFGISARHITAAVRGL